MSLRRDADWPPALVPWRDTLPLFEWLRAGDDAAPRFFGIRRLIGQAPFRLSDLRARGYHTASSRRPVRPPVTGSVEHYLIAEIPGPEMALVNLCMLSPPEGWYVLDEHRITPDSPAEH